MCAATLALSILCIGASARVGADPDNAADSIKTATPIVDGSPTPPGLYVTPTAPLTNAIQQQLNPGLTNYPDYVAGEAVKAVVSPDGKILAILTAGFNSLYKPFVAGSRATVRSPFSEVSLRIPCWRLESGPSLCRPIRPPIAHYLHLRRTTLRVFGT